MGHRRSFAVISGLGALLLASCLQSASPPSHSPSATPVATPTPVAAKFSPKPIAAARPSDLVVRLDASGDVCCPTAVAVLTADGRFVTRADDNQLSLRRLTAVGIQRVRNELVGTGLFERDQRFGLEVLPGANPPGRGVGGLSFKMWRDTRTVEVHTVMGMGPDEVYFVPSTARTRLDQLWKHS